MELSTLQQTQPRPSATRARVLLADADPAVRDWFKPVLGRIIPQDLVEVSSGKDLEAALFRGQSLHLVVTNARLHGHSALASLARVRAAGARTPFIVYTSFQDSLMRILVSDVEGSVLSSRLVGMEDLGELAKSLVRH